ncbi:MAG: SAM-dependent methyltransferase [Clostridia bacterium]|nr:SAM-dependent methyltransferase [Clostridia bacterium]
MLTDRLNCIINYVNCDCAADIGTDHAYVATELIRLGRAKHVIAADVRQGPLNAATENIKKNSMENKIETRLGSGLSVLKKGEADAVVIAGMGGELICEILAADIDIAKETVLYLQPMNAQYEVRRFLIENNFRIVKEDIVCEGERVYNVIIAENGERKPFLKEIDYHLPPYLKEHSLYEKLLNKKKREFTKIVKGLKASKNCDKEKLTYYEKLLSEI